MPGVGLSAQGLAEATALAEVLAGLPIRAVLTSPMQRAQETATPIATRFGQAAIVDEGLNELDYGAWTGAAFADLTGPAWEAWNTNRAMAAPPGGETMLAAQARAVGVMTRAAAGGGTVVLVSHQDVLKAMLAHVLGLSLDLLHRFDLAPASRSIVCMGPGWARVEATNLR